MRFEQRSGCRRRENRNLVAGVLLVWLAVTDAGASSITIESASLRSNGEKYVLDAHVFIELNSAVQRGLLSGVPLHFNVDVSIVQYRRYWWDKRVASFRRRYSLVYYELTRHYRVSVENEDMARNFRSLLRALDYLGNIRGMALFEAPLVEHKSSLYSELEVFLDVSSLPLPLQPQTLVSSAWRLRSEEFRWPIN